MTSLAVAGCATPSPDEPDAMAARERPVLSPDVPRPGVGHLAAAFDIAAWKLARSGVSGSSEMLAAGFFVADVDMDSLLEHDIVVLRLLQHVLTSEMIRSSREVYGGADGERAGVALVHASPPPGLAQALAELGIGVRAPGARRVETIPPMRSASEPDGLGLGLAVGKADPGFYTPAGVEQSLGVLMWTDHGEGGGFGSSTHCYTVRPAVGGVIVWYLGEFSA